MTTVISMATANAPRAACCSRVPVHSRSPNSLPSGPSGSRNDANGPTRADAAPGGGHLEPAGAAHPRLGAQVEAHLLRSEPQGLVLVGDGDGRRIIRPTGAWGRGRRRAPRRGTGVVPGVHARGQSAGSPTSGSADPAAGRRGWVPGTQEILGLLRRGGPGEPGIDPAERGIPTMSKVIAVTGASSGIGEATALRLAAGGHHVVLGARREDRLAAVAEKIRAEGGSADVRRFDVTDRQAVAAFVEAAVAAHGRLDVLVGNAGVMPLSRLDALLVDEWDRMIDVNVKGLLHGIAAALPVFQRQGGGHFVTVASIAAHQVSQTAAVYAATKHAAW